MLPELRDLKWAIVASRHRSLRQAAEALNIRQSTLSRRLRDLEHEIGIELFERTNGGTKPTLLGREFLDSIARILDEIDCVLRRMKSLSRAGSGRLKIGLCSSLSAGNLRATLAEYRRRFEGVEIHAVEGAKDRLLGELAVEAIDVAILSACNSGWGDGMLPLWSERAIIALPERHPLSARPAVDWRELSNERILLTQWGVDPELERILVDKLRCVGRPRILYQSVGFDRMLGLVGAGFGVLPMLEGATGAVYPGVTYRELRDEFGPTRVHFTAYWRATNSNPALGLFLDLLRDRYPDLSVSVASD